MDRRNFLKAPLAAVLPVPEVCATPRATRRVDAGVHAWCQHATVVDAVTGEKLDGILWADESTARVGVFALDSKALDQFKNAAIVRLEGDVCAVLQCARVEIDFPAFVIRVRL